MSQNEPHCLRERATLYIRAERTARTFFSETFDTLCAICGTTARESGQHVCCCIGVECIKHVRHTPLLHAMLAERPDLEESFARQAAAGSYSLLGPRGYMLDWGRPPPCNVCMCGPQRTSLCELMPAADVVELMRRLRVFHALARCESKHTLKELEHDVEALEEHTGKIRAAIHGNRERFETALHRAAESIRGAARSALNSRRTCEP